MQIEVEDNYSKVSKGSNFVIVSIAWLWKVRIIWIVPLENGIFLGNENMISFSTNMIQ